MTVLCVTGSWCWHYVWTRHGTRVILVSLQTAVTLQQPRLCRSAALQQHRTLSVSQPSLQRRHAEISHQIIQKFAKTAKLRLYRETLPNM